MVTAGKADEDARGSCHGTVTLWTHRHPLSESDQSRISHAVVGERLRTGGQPRQCDARSMTHAELSFEAGRGIADTADIENLFGHEQLDIGHIILGERVLISK